MKRTGFTLAELLTVLSVFAVIATFTIPKIVTSQQTTKWNAAAKEMIAAISEGHMQLKAKNVLSANTTAGDIINNGNFNYTSIKTTGLIDDVYGGTSIDCSQSYFTCYVLHNGGVLLVEQGKPYTATGANNALPFIFDPDGVYSGSSTGSGKSLFIFMYYNGKIRDFANIDNPTYVDYWGYIGPYSPQGWFKWQ